MYDVGRLLPIFTSILGSYHEYAHNEYYFYCPFCHHHNPKLAVNLGKGAWQCWTCGNRGGRLLSLLRRLDVSPNQIRELRDVLADEIRYVQDDKATAALALPSEFQPLWKPSKEIERKHALYYLKERGITAGDILNHNIGYCSSGQYQNRIIIPSYDDNGRLNYFVGRDFFGNSYMPYLNPKVSKNVVGFESHINWNHELTVCEGVFDALAIKWNAIPLFGKYIPTILKQQIVSKNVKSICLALDKDALKETIHIAESFLKEGIIVRIVELPEKDPSQLGFLKMRSLIKQAPELTFGDLLRLKLSLTGSL